MGPTLGGVLPLDSSHGDRLAVPSGGVHTVRCDRFREEYYHSCATMKYEELIDFLEHKMSMSHVYQPLLVRALVDAGGAATLRQLVQVSLRSRAVDTALWLQSVTEGTPHAFSVGSSLRAKRTKTRAQRRCRHVCALPKRWPLGLETQVVSSNYC
jgi:hypothetical protein